MNPILEETVKLVEGILGPELDELRVERAVLGLFFSGVKLSDGSGGLCYTPIKNIPEAVCCPGSAQAMPNSGKLARRTVRQYLDDLKSPHVLKKTLAIAMLNALSAACWKKRPPDCSSDYELIMGADAFDETPLPKEGEKAVVIGALAPILRRLLKAGVDFKVLEMDPATLKPAELAHYARAEEASVYVPRADINVITGVTLINDTLPDLLKLVRPGAKVIVAGPTASMLPEAFFKRGVTLLGGVLATRPDELLDIISEGGSGYHFFGKYAERLLIRKKAQAGTPENTDAGRAWR